jgi:hypothetical protein
MRVLLLVPILLAGCATPIPATQVSDISLCRYQWGGGQDAVVAQAEAQRRGLDCTPHFPAIAAQEQAREAAASAWFRSMATQNQRPAPQMRSCNSYRLGNTIQTDCN